MLKFFSRLERTRNFVLFLIAILMAVSLIFFYAPTRNAVQDDLTRSEETVAKVGSEQVTIADLAFQKQNASRYGRGLPGKFLLDGLIRERIVRAEAKRLGLEATDAEVATYIRSQFKSSDGSQFNQENYEQRVTEQYGSVVNFERAVRDQLSGQRIEAFITSGVSVSEEEVLNDFKRRNTKFDLSYVPVNSADLAQTLKPTDDELKSYFERNKATYRIDVPQKKIRYVFVNTAKIGEKLSISEEDLKAEYEKVPTDKKQAGVEGQQLVLRIPKPADEAQVSAKANSIVADARSKEAGGKISAEAFAELARGQSEDPRSAANGGKLSGLVRANPNNPSDPYQRLLTMQPGDVTEPIKYQDKYYILRRGEAVAKNYEDAKKEIEVSLKNRRAYTVAAELAQKVSESLKQTKDASKTAAEFAAQANMNSTEMVRETGFVKPGDDVPNIGTSPQFEEGIAGLENAGDVGEKIPVKDGFAIPVLVEKREPRDAEFDEVKDKVAEAFKLDQARLRVEEIAKQIAEGASSAANLEAAAQGKGLKAQEATSFILGSPLGQGPSATTSEALEDAIYGLRVGEVTKTPVKIGDNWYVVGVKSRTEASTEEFTKQRDELFQASLTEKRGQVFSDYLAAQRADLEAKGNIKIYQEALDKVDAADANTTGLEE